MTDAMTKPSQLAADLLVGRGYDGAMTYAEDMVRRVDAYEHKVTWMHVCSLIREAKALHEARHRVEIIAPAGADPAQLSHDATCPCCRGTQWYYSPGGPRLCGYCEGVGRLTITPRRP